MTGAAELDAIILAGGRSSRLGGVDKATLMVDGERLIDRAVAAARLAGAREVVVVGRSTLRVRAQLVQENPPFGGPVAGIAAGLAVLPGGAARVLVLACDVLDPGPAIAALLGASRNGITEGVCLVDDSGRTQWLTGIYDRAMLSRRLATADPDGRSARDLLHGAELQLVPADLTDVDTWQDLPARTVGDADD